MTSSDGLSIPILFLFFCDIPHFSPVVACSEVNRITLAFSRHLLDTLFRNTEKVRNFISESDGAAAIPNDFDVLQALLVDPLL